MKADSARDGPQNLSAKRRRVQHAAPAASSTARIAPRGHARGRLSDERRPAIDRMPAPVWDVLKGLKDRGKRSSHEPLHGGSELLTTPSRHLGRKMSPDSPAGITEGRPTKRALTLESLDPAASACSETGLLPRDGRGKYPRPGPRRGRCPAPLEGIRKAGLTLRGRRAKPNPKGVPQVTGVPCKDRADGRCPE